MRIGLGIDTGGTHTDAVIYEFNTNTILAKGKAQTTKEDLTSGIGLAIDALPRELVAQASIVSLSTTLATNACVENKGGRGKLLLLGTTPKVLEWIEADSKYGLKQDDILCLDSSDELDWNEILDEADDWLRDADALSVAEVYAYRNGASGEKAIRQALETRYHQPVVLASDLVSGLNVMERGATALLNARLLPIIQEFIGAVTRALNARGIEAPAMIVRSDGSLMSEGLTKFKPVETILSGPATSVLGGKGLTQRENCIIVDMGGTTTDISLVKNGVPSMATNGIRLGGWRTQVAGVFTDTFAQGGDSAIRMHGNEIQLCARRVQPLCVTAQTWPGIITDLRELLDQRKSHSHPLYEFLYLAREAQDLSRYNAQEIALYEALQAGPCMLGNLQEQTGIDLYQLDSERLEYDGVVMRCGLTPTDIMHIKDDFSLYNKEASVLATRYFLNNLSGYEDDHATLLRFADHVYDLVKRKLYENVVRVLLTDRDPDLFDRGIDRQLQVLIAQSWFQQANEEPKPFFDLNFSTKASLIGIGAPTHLFLPDVAQKLGTDYVIPEHAEVANALGAVIADVNTSVEIAISPNYTAGGITGYTVHTPDGIHICDTLNEATQLATRVAILAAKAEARRRGALGELSVETQASPQTAYAQDGEEIDLGVTVSATVTGRIF